MKCVILSGFTFIVLFSVVLASESPDSNTLRQMRLKQQKEEKVLRVIQHQSIRSTQYCLTDQMVRKRLGDLETDKKKTIGDLTVEAGHGSVSIQDNAGTIDNSVNIQVHNPNEQNCL
jgi:hypothetical protein